MRFLMFWVYFKMLHILLPDTHIFLVYHIKKSKCLLKSKKHKNLYSIVKKQFLFWFKTIKFLSEIQIQENISCRFSIKLLQFYIKTFIVERFKKKEVLKFLPSGPAGTDACFVSVLGRESSSHKS